MLTHENNYIQKEDGTSINVVSKLHTRLSELETHKLPYIQNAERAWNEYNGIVDDGSCGEGQQDCGNGKSNTYSVNLLYGMVNTMMASYGSSLPGLKFFGLDDDGQKAAKILFHVIMYWIMNDNTQKKILQAIQDGALSGAGYLYIHFTDTTKKVKVSEWKKGKKQIKEKEIIDYYGPSTQWIPFGNVFHDGFNLYDANEVFIKRVIDVDEFHHEFNPEYSSLYEYNIEDVMTKSGDEEVAVIEGETVLEDAQATEDQKARYENVTVVEYFNTTNNTWVVLANDMWINKHEGDYAPNPYPHRRVPLTEFVPFPNAYHQYGDTVASLTNQQRKQYDEYQEYIIKAQNANFGFMYGNLFDDDSFTISQDEATGLRYLAGGYDMKDIGSYNPRIDVGLALRHKEDIKTDMILVTGVDFTNMTISNPYETSTSVNVRKQSFDKRMNLSIKQNYMCFFNEIIEQWISNIQYMYDDKKKKMSIMFEDTKTRKDDNGNIIVETSVGDFGSVDITSEDVQGIVKFKTFLDGDMLVGPNRQSQMEELEHMINMLRTLVKSDGTKLISDEQLLSLIDKKLSYWDVPSADGGNSIETQELLKAFEGNRGGQVPVNGGIQNTQVTQDNIGLPPIGSRSNLGAEI